MVRLGINIDHVATLRQARGEDYPSVTKACELACLHGADQITIHLREDRRHIQESDLADVSKICREKQKLFNLELATAEQNIAIAQAADPDWICIVPEKREERTTEGGLALENKNVWEKTKSFCEHLRAKLPRTKLSLFLEAQISTLELGRDLGVDAVEIHTGDYARQVLANGPLELYLESFEAASKFLTSQSMGTHAGHGLTNKSLVPLVSANLFQEYNIGHWVISESVFEGLGKTVSQLAKIIRSKGATE